MSADMREKIVARLMKTLDDDDAGHREATAAAKALIMADRLNLQSQHAELVERIELLEEADEQRERSPEASDAPGATPPAADAH